jgi:hypothetical protein
MVRPTIASLNSLAAVLKALQPLHSECTLILHGLDEPMGGEIAANTNNATPVSESGSKHTVRPRSLYARRRFLAGIDRAELYRKVWTMPIKEVAAEYGLSYHQFEQICHLIKVPKPPRGFWSKKAFGKPTGSIPLLLPLRTDIPAGTAPASESSVLATPPVSQVNSVVQTGGQDLVGDRPVLLVPGGLMSLYNREQLYEDVWSFPMSKLAEKYGVSDRALAKACRKLHIPVPTMGHWNKVAVHKPGDEKLPLPRVEIAPRTIRRKTHNHSLEEAASMVLQIDHALLNGSSLRAACDALDVSEATYWRWKKASRKSN